MSELSISTSDSRIKVGRTEVDGLPPVRVAIFAGQRLIAIAAATEEVGPSTSFDDVVDRKMAELKFIEVALEPVTA